MNGRIIFHWIKGLRVWTGFIYVKMVIHLQIPEKGISWLAK